MPYSATTVDSVRTQAVPFPLSPQLLSPTVDTAQSSVSLDFPPSRPSVNAPLTNLSTSSTHWDPVTLPSYHFPQSGDAAYLGLNLNMNLLGAPAAPPDTEVIVIDSASPPVSEDNYTMQPVASVDLLPQYSTTSASGTRRKRKMSSANSLSSASSTQSVARSAAHSSPLSEPLPPEVEPKRIRRGRTGKAARNARFLPETCFEYRPVRRQVKKPLQLPIMIIPTPTVPQPPCDDKDGHYALLDPETPLTDRYVIKSMLGQGTFGKVVSAFDKHEGRTVAIKIIRSIPKYRDASKIEVRVMTTIAQYDKNNANKCIHMRHCFDFRNHICIVTDLLDISVFDFLKRNHFHAFPGSHIQSMAKQLLRSVAYMHDLNLIHTDLKPENILLESAESTVYPAQRAKEKPRQVLKNSQIYLIDFGSSIFNDEYHSAVVSTRHYRAPEIVLGTGWSFPCDLWSVGCILIELFSGDALFQTHDNLEHLAMMQVILSAPVPRTMLSEVCYRGLSSEQYFSSKGLNYPNETTTKKSKKYVGSLQSLDQMCAEKIHSLSNHNEVVFWVRFFDLVKSLLVWEPNKRLTAKEALRHAWFDCEIHDEGTEGRL